MTPAPAAWTLSVEDGLLRIEMRGVFALPDLLRFLLAVPTTPGFRPSMDALVDLRQVEPDLPFRDAVRLRRAFETYMVRRGTGFRAACVFEADAEVELGSMLGTLVRDLPLRARAFHSMDEAMAWLRDGNGADGPDGGTEGPDDGADGPDEDPE